jgi:AraC-like DNA-binding protein
MAFEASPRLASVFATQQRWLLAHLGASLYFRRDPLDPANGLRTARFLEMVHEHAVASRNTADAFLKEMLNYNFVQYGPAGKDKRIRPLEPTKATLDALSGWAMVHLSTLDSLDGGHRLDSYLAGPDSLARLQPLIADGLLTSNAVREPARTFSLFTWLNNGGIVMDWLISGIEPADAEADRIPTGVLSVADMARWLKLSRTHLARKLREAEALGSIGWQGKRGHSVMWVSKDFRREYTMAQAVKLAIIDAASDACFGPASQRRL